MKIYVNRKTERIVFMMTCLLGLWLSFILLAPLMIHSNSLVIRYLGTGIYFLFDPVCHQLPERSLFLSGIPFPVCTRCMFIYSGGFLIFFTALLRKTKSYWAKQIYFGLVIIIGGELFFEKILLYHTFLEFRILTGLLAGILIFRIVLESIFLLGEYASNE